MRARTLRHPTPIRREPPCAPRARVAATLAALLLALAVPPAQARKGDEKQPMLIEADTVQVDEGQSISLYIGRVQVDQGTMRLLADQVTVHHHPDRRVRFIIARGNPAAYRQLMDDDKEVQAFGKRMDFDADRNELVLTEEAVVIQGSDRVASDRIVYDRAHGRIQASGENRVKIRFTPESAKQERPTPPPAPPSRP